jgi:hypothetical protein
VIGTPRTSSITKNGREFSDRMFDLLQCGEGIVEVEPRIHIPGRSRQSVNLDRGWAQAPAPFPRLSAARGIDQDSAHRLGGYCEEMSATGECPVSDGTNESNIDFVNEGGGVQCVAGRLVCHVPGRQPAQFVINERQQVGRRLRVSCFDGAQDTSDLVHTRMITEPHRDLGRLVVSILSFSALRATPAFLPSCLPHIV